MKKTTSILQFLFSITLLFFFSLTYAQELNTIKFRGETIEMPENILDFDWSTMPESSIVEKGYVGWIQFYETPDQETQNLFKANGLVLMNYIPHQTYLFYFPKDTSISLLKENGVRSIIPVPTETRFMENLKSNDFEYWAWDGNRLKISLEYHKDTNLPEILNDLKQLDAITYEVYEKFHIIELSIHPNELPFLADRSYVMWAELVSPPSIKDDDNGRALHRANGLESPLPTGRDYTGRDIGVMVRDDGFVGPHIDFQGRIINYSNRRNASHGDGVAGIVGGAGNIIPHYRGMAIGSEIFGVDYVPSFLDSRTNILIDNGLSQITNSSYSDGCNDGYTSIARTVDQQTLDTPSLLHVFSAGNSNGSNCGYGAGGQWGNITGGHKMGKNVMTTANVFANATIVSSSSRGPATDGRLKPDITAHGQNQMSTDENQTYQTFGGTSAAAPGIAGISAQLYELYKDNNNDELPPSALIKAAMLNTANDAGNEGPDFKFGWGIVNGLRAGMLIEDERYLSEEISQGNTNTHNVNIPSGTAQVRFMLYWSDKAATPGANPALVNDLDLKVKTPSNTTLLPWILDHTPNATALDSPAEPGIDRLNNMEQVLINAPAAGNYEISVEGFNIPQGPQEYFVVYEIISDNVTLTYPNGGETFRSSSTEYIQWDAVDVTANFVLEYSIDDGNSWTNISTVPSDRRLYQWSVPSSVSTGKALIRVTSGSYQDVSEANFNIAPNPTQITVTQVCEDSMTFNWTEISDAEAYDLYVLGEKYMEVVATSTENTITIPITDPDAEIWYAYSAKNETEGWKSARSRARRYSGGLKSCSMNVDDFELNNAILLYPNPATNEIHIQSKNNSHKIERISITNNLGLKIKEINMDSSSEAIVDVTAYQTGIYFVTISGNDFSITKKLIVN